MAETETKTIVILEDDPRLLFVPFAEAATPPGGLIEHLKDRYWIAHPDKGILYWVQRSHRTGRIISSWPQCNSNKGVALHEKFSSRFPWATVVFMPSVFRKIDPKDYVS